MNAGLENFYKQQGQPVIPSNWYAQLKNRALENFMQRGFPSRMDESWKYTSLETFYKHHFKIAQHNTLAHQPVSAPFNQPALCMSLYNGQFSSADVAPQQGMIICSLRTAIDLYSDKIKKYFDNILPHTHGFQDLNTGLNHSGLFIYLPENYCLEQPLYLLHWQDQPEAAVYSRNIIIAENNSQGTIIEQYSGSMQCSYLTNAMTEILLGNNAELNHFKIQTEGNAAYHIGHIAIEQHANSVFNSHILSLGGQLVRSDLSVILKQSNARCLLNGIYAPMDRQHIDHHTTINHAVANCHSTQNYKGILGDHAHGVFSGKIIVSKAASQTIAEQQNKNLLLSPYAEIDTQPQLDIFNDDVICSHGATVGQLDEEALFYLATRGLNRQAASNYLINAFAIENWQLISHPQLANWMQSLLQQHLAKVGAIAYES